jgi:hypothetical protein
MPPGVYFRMLLVGYFEGIDSQRGIAWPCGDSLSSPEFLGIAVGLKPPDHSTLTFGGLNFKQWQHLVRPYNSSTNGLEMLDAIEDQFAGRLQFG